MFRKMKPKGEMNFLHSKIKSTQNTRLRRDVIRKSFQNQRRTQVNGRKNELRPLQIINPAIIILRKVSIELSTQAEKWMNREHGGAHNP